jgi:hypothetical protein
LLAALVIMGGVYAYMHQAKGPAQRKRVCHPAAARHCGGKDHRARYRRFLYRRNVRTYGL